MISGMQKVDHWAMSRLQRCASEDGASEGDFVSVFQPIADADAAGNDGDFEVKVCQAA